MNISIDKKRFLFYVWIASAYFLLWLIINADRYPEFLANVFNNLWRGTYIVVVNFIFFEATLPFIRRKRKRVIYTVLLFLSAAGIQLVLASFGMYAWRNVGIALQIYTPSVSDFSSSREIADQAAYGLTSLLFFGGILHIYDHIKLKGAAQQLQIEKQAAELNYLKSQTNPHFLFNTLNNIYSLARDKSDLAPESILRLSQMLRFMLYETGGAYIAIEQELKIISDYIALEKLRYDDTLAVSFICEVEDPNMPLPPLLLIPLVENAFKHGVSETRRQPFVDIRLSVQDLQLIFTVGNSSGQPMERDEKETIGLPNLRRQLELLFTDFSLSVHQGKTMFSAALKINLASHV